jgi:hypothetical protein
MTINFDSSSNFVDSSTFTDADAFTNADSFKFDQNVEFDQEVDFSDVQFDTADIQNNDVEFTQTDVEFTPITEPLELGPGSENPVEVSTAGNLSDLGSLNTADTTTGNTSTSASNTQSNTPADTPQTQTQTVAQANAQAQQDNDVFVGLDDDLTLPQTITDITDNMLRQGAAFFSGSSLGVESSAKTNANLTLGVEADTRISEGFLQSNIQGAHAPTLTRDNNDSLIEQTNKNLDYFTTNIGQHVTINTGGALIRANETNDTAVTNANLVNQGIEGRAQQTADQKTGLYLEQNQNKVETFNQNQTVANQQSYKDASQPLAEVQYARLAEAIALAAGNPKLSIDEQNGYVNAYIDITNWHREGDNSKPEILAMVEQKYPGLLEKVDGNGSSSDADGLTEQEAYNSYTQDIVWGDSVQIPEVDTVIPDAPQLEHDPLATSMTPEQHAQFKENTALFAANGPEAVPELTYSDLPLSIVQKDGVYSPADINSLNVKPDVIGSGTHGLTILDSLAKMFIPGYGVATEITGINPSDTLNNQVTAGYADANFDLMDESLALTQHRAEMMDQSSVNARENQKAQIDVTNDSNEINRDAYKAFQTQGTQAVIESDNTNNAITDHLNSNSINYTIAGQEYQNSVNDALLGQDAQISEGNQYVDNQLNDIGQQNAQTLDALEEQNGPDAVNLLRYRALEAADNYHVVETDTGYDVVPNENLTQQQINENNVVNMIGETRNVPAFIVNDAAEKISPITTTNEKETRELLNAPPQ